MDPMGDFGPGGLGNEVHLGGTSQTMFPSSTSSWGESGEAGTWQGGGYYRPSLTSRIGGRIFGSAWGKIARLTSGLIRLSCAGAGFYFGGHYTGEWGLGTTDVPLLIGGLLGGVLGFFALPLIRIYIPVVLLLGGVYLAIWFFFGNPFA